MSILQDSWGAFSKKTAKEYLKSFGSPSPESKLLLFEVLSNMPSSDKLNILDLGCGNANLAEFLNERGLRFSYTGVDFSETLLDAAKNAFSNANFIQDDVNTLTKVKNQYDVAIYSHVIEMLPSPEASLLAAQKIAKKIVIRFFEPPEFETDWVELLSMDTGEGVSVPYLRRRMSKDYYRLILSKMNCKSVDVYRDGYKDQIHILHY